MTDLFMKRGAEFDGENNEYRTILYRTWAPERARLVFIMLNPSTADGETDDATIRICMGRAQRMGAGGIRVANLFMLRATDPALLRTHPDPVGPRADIRLEQAIQGQPLMVIAAWGDDGLLKGYGRPRWEEACEVLCYDMGVQLHALRLTKAGQPGHPLRIPYSTDPFPWMDRSSWPKPAPAP
jgi:hypothetical protein